VFNLRMGMGGRQIDWPPYRSMGPLTKEEYESRAERYEKQMKELIGIDPEGKSTEGKMAILREWREGRHNKLCDAVYARRGWTNNAIPTLETLKKFKIDFSEVVAVVTPHL
jgi:aldehyde:ferredoxin oxidoreductase